jgi:hypothetical protein
VGVVAAEVGPDEQRGDPRRVAVRRAHGAEDAGGPRFEAPGIDGRHVGYNTSAVKTEREFFDPGPLPWRPAPGFVGGVSAQVISGGLDEGVTARLLRFDPGSGHDRVVTHDF